MTHHWSVLYFTSPIIQVDPKFNEDKYSVWGRMKYLESVSLNRRRRGNDISSDI